MRIDILTLFPEMFQGGLTSSIIGRAGARGLLDIHLHNIRDYAHDRHRTVDDYPYGGGAGMILKPEPIFEATEALLADTCSGGSSTNQPRIILLTPQGQPFSQNLASKFSEYGHLVVICGHYAGVDERVREHLATDEISIGDYILSGGELAAMVVVDAVTRLLPGVLGTPDSSACDSHVSGFLQYPQYTRPQVYQEWAVPSVLLSGNHREIANWRHQQSLLRTMRRRPDLMSKAKLSSVENELTRELVSSEST